jgi:hypothetical protein
MGLNNGHPPPWPGCPGPKAIHTSRIKSYTLGRASSHVTSPRARQIALSSGSIYMTCIKRPGGAYAVNPRNGGPTCRMFVT